MSCQDTAEIIEITLSPDYKLLGYALRKLSCDQAVGQESLLLDKFKDWEISEILESSEVELLQDFTDDIEKYLALKHFQVLCRSLNVLIGNEEQGLCEIESVESVENIIKVVAVITAPQSPNSNNPCAGCQGCKQ